MCLFRYSTVFSKAWINKSVTSIPERHMIIFPWFLWLAHTKLPNSSLAPFTNGFLWSFFFFFNLFFSSRQAQGVNLCWVLVRRREMQETHQNDSSDNLFSAHASINQTPLAKRQETRHVTGSIRRVCTANKYIPFLIVCLLNCPLTIQTDYRFQMCTFISL